MKHSRRVNFPGSVNFGKICRAFFILLVVYLPEHVLRCRVYLFRRRRHRAHGLIPRVSTTSPSLMHEHTARTGECNLNARLRYLMSGIFSCSPNYKSRAVLSCSLASAVARENRVAFNPAISRWTEINRSTLDSLVPIDTNRRAISENRLQSG